MTATQEADAAAVAGVAETVSATDATRAAELFNLAGRRRGSLADCLIAAVTLRAGASLATASRADFASFIPAGPPVVP